ncbi:iron-sulfur cluster assembly accessory protein, partial [Gorgonomyces haynaldii]
TPRAVERLKKITADEALRVQVDAGGCHGYQYKMELVKDQEPDDVVFIEDGAKVLVDPLTLDMIKGSKIDYVDELIGASFQVVDNPRAESSCGCKVSF